MSDIELTSGQFDLVYNALSFSIATMASNTIFVWLGRDQVQKKYQTALTINGLVTFIAFYHYVRIFNSWVSAYDRDNDMMKPSGEPFNDAYRYVDWLLTVPLLLLELILVMGLSPEETKSKAIKLGSLSAVMVALGYPGEVSLDLTTKWIFWALAMIPFCVVVFELFTGLGRSDHHLIGVCRILTVVSWCFYPVVFIFPMLGVSGGAARAAVQVGYTVADVVAKAVFGCLIYNIAVSKSEASKDNDGLLQNQY